MRATGKFLTCVCHCEDSWKNLTPVHSVPSIYTAHAGHIQVPLYIQGSYIERFTYHEVELDATVLASK